GTGVWVGAYLEMLSILAFLGFAAWAVTRLGDGVLAVAARGAAWSYASVSVLSLCVWDAVELRAGHGMGAQLAAALANVGEATFVGTWFLSAGFMLAVGALALAQRRRLLGWSGIAFAAVILAACAAPVSDTGQMAASLPWFVWIVAASIAMARRPRVHAAVPATV
ncbi:MAG: hypothetical protein QOF01_1778, partial [Thermomicrobiales bacterium]|nr:hypothetical protein [Thermomicrobiales bacterium]